MRMLMKPLLAVAAVLSIAAPAASALAEPTIGAPAYHRQEADRADHPVRFERIGWRHHEGRRHYWHRHHDHGWRR